MSGYFDFFTEFNFFSEFREIKIISVRDFYNLSFLVFPFFYAKKTPLFILKPERYPTLKLLKILLWARHQWLKPVILATQEAKIRRITIQSQLWQIVCETQSQKKKKIPQYKNRDDGVAQVVERCLASMKP
jgi:hypothetical protein